ncbi:MAG: M23 family metallopeptidase [Candidatus Desantisbacteria bacterium]
MHNKLLLLCLGSLITVSLIAVDAMAGNYGCPATGKVTQLVKSGHDGVDIANKSMPMVGAAKAGVVCDIRDYGQKGYGKMVTLKHGDTKAKVIRYTRYAYLKRHSLRKNDQLKVGNNVGQMGCTGHCVPKGAVHLHWEVRKTEWGTTYAIGLPLNKDVNRGLSVSVRD